MAQHHGRHSGEVWTHVRKLAKRLVRVTDVAPQRALLWRLATTWRPFLERCAILLHVLG